MSEMDFESTTGLFPKYGVYVYLLPLRDAVRRAEDIDLVLSVSLRVGRR